MAKLQKLLWSISGDSNLIMRQLLALGQWGRFGTNKADARGNELFTDRVNRRICDLCEELLKVIIEELRLIGEDGERCVVPEPSGCLPASALGPAMKRMSSKV